MTLWHHDMSGLGWFLNPAVRSTVSLHSGLNRLWCNNTHSNGWYKTREANPYSWVCTVDLPQRPPGVPSDSIPCGSHFFVSSSLTVCTTRDSCPPSVICQEWRDATSSTGWVTGHEGQSPSGVMLLPKTLLSRGAPCLLNSWRDMPGKERSVSSSRAFPGAEGEVCTAKSAFLTRL